MADPKPKKDPTEEQEPKPQPPAEPAGEPFAAAPATDPAAESEMDTADPKIGHKGTALRAIAVLFSHIRIQP